MQHDMTPPNQPHHLIPRAVQSGASAVHRVFDARFADQALDVSNLRRHGGGGCPQRDQAEVRDAFWGRAGGIGVGGHDDVMVGEGEKVGAGGFCLGGRWEG